LGTYRKHGTLWRRAVLAQRVAQAGRDPITEATLLRKFHQVLTDSGVFSLDLRDWDKKVAADKTWANFRAHFTAANKERIKNATAGTMHSANAAIGTRTRTNGSNTSPSDGSTRTTTTSDTVWSYCWTHGYGKNKEHNSRTCTNKATGHQEDATIDNMKGGNNTIRRKRGERNKFRQLNPQQPRDNNNNNANNNNNNNNGNNNQANSAHRIDATAATAAITDETDDGSQD